MRLIWYTVLIRSIPEAIAIILITLAIIKEKSSLKNILIVGTLCGLVNFIMRMLPLKFGMHILIIVIVQAFIINIILKIKIQNAFKGLLVSMVILIVSELMTIMFIQYGLGLNPEAVFSDAVGTIIAGVPSALLLYAVAYIIFKFNHRRSNKDVVENVN